MQSDVTANRRSKLVEDMAPLSDLLLFTSLTGLESEFARLVRPKSVNRPRVYVKFRRRWDPGQKGQRCTWQAIWSIPW
jgi:hypothetical protein